MKNFVVVQLRRLLDSESEGSSLVELAVTLPLVMLVMTGIFSFSMALYEKVALSEAVSNAGSYLATARGLHDPCAGAIAAVDSAAPGIPANKITVVVTLAGTALPATCPGTGTTGASATFPTGSKGEDVTIEATYVTGLGIFRRQYTNVTLASQISEVVQ